MANYNDYQIDTLRIFFDKNTNLIGSEICYYDVIDSTNTEAKRKSDMPDGTVFIAKHQTNGRGRLGRNWISDESGMWFSVLLKPEISPEKVFQITLIMGLAVCKAIPGASIKWPNDIVMGNRKICGILTEMASENGTVNFVVSGIGLNVNTEKFPEDICDIATSLYLQTNKKTSKTELLSKICATTDKYYNAFLKYGFEAFIAEYRKNCITIDKAVTISENGIFYDAYAVDISDKGELIIKTDSGERKVLSGEASVRGLLGYI